MSKIVGIGASVLDTYIILDDYPFEDKKVKSKRIFQMGGGPVGNALVAIARLGGNAEVLGAFGDDGSAQQILREYDEAHVETKHAVRLKNHSSFVSTLLINEKAGTRTCMFDRGSVEDDPKNINLDIIEKGDILHLDGNYINCALQAAKYCQEKGILVSLDAGGLYAGIEQLLPYVNILIPSEEFAVKITNSNSAEEACLKLQEKYHPEVLVITQGSKGGIYYQNGVKSYKSFKIHCVDSNGAGDTFHGAFIYHYSINKDLVSAIRFAAATSAIKCMKTGVRNALPTLDEVNNFLAKEN